VICDRSKSQHAGYLALIGGARQPSPFTRLEATRSYDFLSDKKDNFQFLYYWDKVTKHTHDSQQQSHARALDFFQVGDKMLNLLCDIYVYESSTLKLVMSQVSGHRF